MNRDEMDLYEKYAAMDPVEVLQQEEEEEYLRYIRERKRRIKRRRRREQMMRRRVRKLRMIAAGTAAAIIILIVIILVVTGNPVRDVLTLQAGSPLPEATAFLRRQNSKTQIYYVSDMTQINMDVAQDTPIIVEVNGKQYTSRLVVEDPNADADASEADTNASEVDTNTSAPTAAPTVTPAP